MRERAPLSALRFISLSLILIAIVLAVLQLIRFSRVRAYLPSGMKIAQVPVEGLDRQQAAQRLLEYYSQPVELRYNGAVAQLSPSIVDFQLDLDNMLAAAELARTQQAFWQEYWDYLWSRSVSPVNIPLKATYSEARLRTYLAEIAAVYDQPAVAALPVPGTVNFQAGRQGSTLDIDASVALIDNALHSLSYRQVDLPLSRTVPGRPAFRNLETLLKQTIAASGFDGLAAVYLLDLQSAQEIHFAIQPGEEVPVEPDIAFTASSIIKIPIMVTVYQHSRGEIDAEGLKDLNDMIVSSGNEVADWLMDRVLEPKKGPLIVSEEMRKIGLENTFLAGYFTFGSPLLTSFKTPANQREDINTDPDPYSQTTTSDIGMLLEDIYQCAQNGGGTLMAAFADSFTQLRCQTMINYLKNNKLPVLLTAGIPEGTQIAHKHGWVSTNGIINTIGDAGIIYTPGGNYIMVVFLHHPQQLVWDPASRLIADLSTAAYNFFNLPSE